MDRFNLEKNYFTKCLEINNIVAMEEDENKLSSPCATGAIFAPIVDNTGFNTLRMQSVPVKPLTQHTVQIQSNIYQKNYFGQQGFVHQHFSNNINNSFLNQKFDFNSRPISLNNWNNNKQATAYFQSKPIQVNAYCNNRKSNQRSFIQYDHLYQKNGNRQKHNTNFEKDENLEPSLKKLGLTPNQNINDLFSLVSQFRKLSYFIQLLWEQRHSFQALLLSSSLSSRGFKPNTNFLPIIITDISNHINLIKQAILHEFVEFDKLFETIPNNYKEFKELNFQIKYELTKLDEYDGTRIRHKNGMLLLPTDKIINLFSIIKTLTKIIREFSIYTKILNFKIKEFNETVKKSLTTSNQIISSQRNHGL